MAYFDQPQPQPPQPGYGQEPAQAYPVDEDGDRIYTEEDYGVPADGDEFLPEDWEGTEEDELLPEELLTPQEQEELRRSNWKLLAGLADFGAIILGTAAILVLITLLVSLINWLVNDITQTFTLLQMQI